VSALNTTTRAIKWSYLMRWGGNASPAISGSYVYILGSGSRQLPCLCPQPQHGGPSSWLITSRKDTVIAPPAIQGIRKSSSALEDKYLYALNAPAPGYQWKYNAFGRMRRKGHFDHAIPCGPRRRLHRRHQHLPTSWPLPHR